MYICHSIYLKYDQFIFTLIYILQRSVFDSQKLFELVKSFSEEGAAVLVAEGDDVISTDSALKMETS